MTRDFTQIEHERAGGFVSPGPQLGMCIRWLSGALCLDIYDRYGSLAVLCTQVAFLSASKGRDSLEDLTLQVKLPSTALANGDIPSDLTSQLQPY